MVAAAVFSSKASGEVLLGRRGNHGGLRFGDGVVQGDYEDKDNLVRVNSATLASFSSSSSSRISSGRESRGRDRGEGRGSGKLEGAQSHQHNRKKSSGASIQTKMTRTTTSTMSTIRSGGKKKNHRDGYRDRNRDQHSHLSNSDHEKSNENGRHHLVHGQRKGHRRGRDPTPRRRGSEGDERNSTTALPASSSTAAADKDYDELSAIMRSLNSGGTVMTTTTPTTMSTTGTTTTSQTSVTNVGAKSESWIRGSRASPSQQQKQQQLEQRLVDDDDDENRRGRTGSKYWSHTKTHDGDEDHDQDRDAEHGSNNMSPQAATDSRSTTRKGLSSVGGSNITRSRGHMQEKQLRPVISSAIDQSGVGPVPTPTATVGVGGTGIGPVGGGASGLGNLLPPLKSVLSISSISTMTDWTGNWKTGTGHWTSSNDQKTTGRMTTSATPPSPVVVVPNSLGNNDFKDKGAYDKNDDDDDNNKFLEKDNGEDDEDVCSDDVDEDGCDGDENDGEEDEEDEGDESELLANADDRLLRMKQPTRCTRADVKTLVHFMMGSLKKQKQRQQHRRRQEVDDEQNDDYDDFDKEFQRENDHYDENTTKNNDENEMSFLLEQSCHVLWKLSAQDPRNDDIIRDSGGITAIMESLIAYPNAVKLQIKALYTLWSLCMSNVKNQNVLGNRKKLVTGRGFGSISSGMEIIANAMERHEQKSEVQGAACLLWSALCAGASKKNSYDGMKNVEFNAKNQEIIRNHHPTIPIIPLILSALDRHVEDEKVVKYACDALSNFMRGSKKNKKMKGRSSLSSQPFDDDDNYEVVNCSWEFYSEKNADHVLSCYEEPSAITALIQAGDIHEHNPQVMEKVRHVLDVLVVSAKGSVQKHVSTCAKKRLNVGAVVSVVGGGDGGSTSHGNQTSSAAKSIIKILELGVFSPDISATCCEALGILIDVNHQDKKAASKNGGKNKKKVHNNNNHVYDWKGIAKTKNTIRQRNGISTITAAMRLHRSHAKVQIQCLYVLIHLSRNSPQTQDDIAMHRNGIQLVYKAMEHHLDNAQVQRCACDIIAKLASSGEHIQGAISDSGLIPCIVHAMEQYENDGHLQRSGCMALAYLSRRNNKVRDVIRSSGGIDVIVHALKQWGRGGRHKKKGSEREDEEHAPYVLEAGYRAMTTHEREALLLLRMGDARGIVHVMTTNNISARVQEEACIELSKLFSISSSSSPNGEKKGGNHKYDRKEVHNMNVNDIDDEHDEEEEARIAATAIRAIMDVMNQFQDDVPIQRAALSAMITISSKQAKHSQQTQNEAQENRCSPQQQHPKPPPTYCYQSIIHAAGAVPSIVSSMQRHPTDGPIQGRACCALANVCRNHSTNQSTVRREGAIPLIIKGMTRHLSNADVQTFGSASLANLCCWNTPHYMEDMRNSDGVDALIAAIRHHKENKRVTEPAIGALRNLERDAIRIIDRCSSLSSSSSSTLSAKVMNITTKTSTGATLSALSPSASGASLGSSGGGGGDGNSNVRVIVRLMRIHIHSPLVQSKACHALWMLSARSDRYDNIIREAGGISSIITALKKHVDSFDDKDGPSSSSLSFDYSSPMSTSSSASLSSSSSVVEEALGALWNLTSNNVKNQDAIRESGGIPAICEAMQRSAAASEAQEQQRQGSPTKAEKEKDQKPPKYEYVIQGNGCCTLANLASHNIKNQNSIRTAGGLILILRNMTNPYLIQNANVQNYVCGAMANVTYRNEENGRGLVNMNKSTGVGAVQALLRCMEVHTERSDVQGTACAALSNLCDYEDENRQNGKADEGKDTGSKRNNNLTDEVLNLLRNKRAYSILKHASMTYPEECGACVNDILSKMGKRDMMTNNSGNSSLLSTNSNPGSSDTMNKNEQNQLPK